MIRDDVPYINKCYGLETSLKMDLAIVQDSGGYLSGENLVSLNGMFICCTSLKEVDLSRLKRKRIQDVSYILMGVGDHRRWTSLGLTI